MWKAQPSFLGFENKLEQETRNQELGSKLLSGQIKKIWAVEDFSNKLGLDSGSNISLVLPQVEPSSRLTFSIDDWPYFRKSV